MSNQISQQTTEHKLRLNILRLLYDAKTKRTNSHGGYAGQGLRTILKIADEAALVEALKWLKGRSYVTDGEKAFVITEDGERYYLMH